MRHQRSGALRTEPVDSARVISQLRIAPVIVSSGQPHTLRDAVTQADAVIAKPFATDTLLAEVIRSRKQKREKSAGDLFDLRMWGWEP